MANGSSIKKPRALRKGDRVATVSLSWGGPGAIPERYEIGKQQLEETFGIEVVEMRHTCADADFIANNPQARADDLMQAFSDSSIAGIVSTIGGDDSFRLIPYINQQIITDNPKIFLGYSDSTVTHLACLKAGVSSFYGPSIMSGFAENRGIPDYLRESVEQNLFRTDPPGVIRPNENGWTVEHLDWSVPENNRTRRKSLPCTGWRYLQGTQVSQGRLIGGCLEVLEFLRGTNLWPTSEQWRGATLFVETSEEGPSPAIVARAMRSYAAEGVLQSLNGILFGRPGGNKTEPEKFFEYDDAIRQVVRDEQGLDQLPIVTNMDFGHTDPMMRLPFGAMTQIDCLNQQIQILESSVSL